MKNHWLVLYRKLDYAHANSQELGQFCGYHSVRWGREGSETLKGRAIKQRKASKSDDRRHVNDYRRCTSTPVQDGAGEARQRSRRLVCGAMSMARGCRENGLLSETVTGNAISELPTPNRAQQPSDRCSNYNINISCHTETSLPTTTRMNFLFSFMGPTVAALSSSKRQPKL